MTPANTALHPLAASGTINAAIYIRVSTAEQALEGYSLPQQIAACEQYAAQYGLHVAPHHLFQDVETGTIATRTGLDQLRLAIRRGEVQAVILYKVARFARNLIEMLLLLDEFAQAGVAFYDTGSAPMPLTSERLLQLHIQGAVAQYEHAQILERAANGIRGRAQAGYPMPQHTPLGYRYEGTKRKGRYVCVEEEAAIVRRIFHLYVSEQRGIRAIARVLTLERLPTWSDRHRPHTPTRRHAPGVWNRASILRILHNRIYIGTRLYGVTKRVPKAARGTAKDRRTPTAADQWITIEVPPIISPELFTQAALQREANQQHSPRNARHFYLLGGARLQCGLCRYTMSGTGKGPYRYYRCNSPGVGLPDPCHRTLPVGRLDAYIWERTQALVRQPEVLLALFDAQCAPLDPHQTFAEQQRLEAAIAAAEAEAELLLEAYLKQQISGERMQKKQRQIDQEQAARHLRLQALADQALTAREHAAYRQTLEERLATFGTYCAQIGDDGPAQQRLLDALGLIVVYWEDELRLHVRFIREPLRPEDGFPIASIPARWGSLNRENATTITLTYACPWPAGASTPTAGATDGPTVNGE